ncbi:MAG: [Firmicutes bacterium]|nr:[FeFe] hydrogenase H-cluster radical SAM maturase HydE [Bacillota bacterium]
MITEQLEKQRDLTDGLLQRLMEGEEEEALFAAADRVRRENYGDAVYVRGLIEFTNHCRNDCYYCGIRRSNRSLSRYRLDRETILACCREGYGLGYRTFVLQGGEDPWYTDEILCDIVSQIHREHPDCAITLSLGERSRDSYQRLFEAGARRYLLRQEAADEKLYRMLHPSRMSCENRKRCLYALKGIGYQVGSGFMVGAPGQRWEHLIGDLRFLQQLQPDMIGIGPYLRHQDTPYRDQPNGSMQLTLRLIAILRLMFPGALIPSTTALGTIDPQGRELGLKAGANVVMPNLSPAAVREKYELYDNKICTGEESAQCRSCLEMRVFSAGYRIVTDIGDPKKYRASDRDL